MKDHSRKSNKISGDQILQKQINSKTCFHCNTENPAEALFCEECGIDLSNKQTTCPVCGESTAGAYCEFCGADVKGKVCSKCGIVQYTDYCTECGEALSEIAMRLDNINTNQIIVEELSESQALSIINDLNASLTPAMKKEQENKRQRIILLREREYFQNREKRIEEYYAAGSKINKLTDPAELKAIKDAAIRLRGFVKSEETRIEKEIAINEEKLRRERFNNRVDGVWVTTSGIICGTMKLTNNGNVITGSIHIVQPQVERVDSIQGTWEGNIININTIKMRTIYISFGYLNVPVIYSATVNNAGDTMSGHLRSAEHWHEIFIKQ